MKEVLAQIDKSLQKAKDWQKMCTEDNMYYFCEGEISAYKEIKILIERELEDYEV